MVNNNKRQNRYKVMERYMTYTLIGDAALFVLYLIFAATGVIWLKVITAIFAILISLGCLAFLYLSQELLRKRSFWMTTAAAAVLICTLMSLILNFPRPNTYKDIAPDAYYVQDVTEI